jgi:CRP/FNR family transcriptional regulator
MITHDDVIYTTHNEISDDLHTSRVVISRLLKKLENEGKIKLFRNSIKVLVL